MKRFHPANGSLRNMTVQGINCTEEQRQNSRIEKANSEKSSGEKSVLLPSSYTKCPHCEKDFSKGGCLPRHIERRHVPRPCKICGITFSNAEKLSYHKVCYKLHFYLLCLTQFLQVMAHKGPKHECSHCPKTFQTVRSLRLHLSICKDKKFSCELCGVKFKTLQYVVRHKHIFHQDKEKTKKARNFRQNNSKNRTQKQTKKNALEIPLEKTISNLVVGPMCGKNFSNVESTHQKTICIICGMTFTSADELMKHKVCLRCAVSL